MAAGLLTPFRVLWKRRALERGPQWNRAALEAHQHRSVQALRRFTQTRSPFYQHFHRGLERRPLSELPILSKSTLMENFDELVTDRSLRLAELEAYLRLDAPPPLFRNRYVVLATSGSTGRRGVFLFNPSEWIHALACIARPMAWAGLTASRPPRSVFIASNTRWHYSGRVSTSLATRLLPALRLDATEPLDSMVRQLNDWQPHVLAGYPSVLKQLAEEQIAGRLRIALKSVATSAEVLTDDIRHRVQQAWAVRVYDTYGATEYAPIAAECAEGRKHLFEDGAVIEIVDERGRPVPSGELGDRVLITVFNRWTQPLIRYEISDMARPIAGECGCGRKLQLIERIEGRVEEVLTFPSRTGAVLVPVHPNVFHQLLETAPVAGWQVAQESDGLNIRVVGLRDPSWPEQFPGVIRRRLEETGAEAPPVRVLPVDALQRGASGKAPLIFSQPRPVS